MFAMTWKYCLAPPMALHALMSQAYSLHLCTSRHRSQASGLKKCTARTSRTPLIRITNVGAIGPRVVLRSPDGASNPYLVLAGCLAAGLEGVREKLEPPVSMDEAIHAFEEDTFLQNVFGKTLSEIIINEKKEEWEEFSRQVTAWEVEKYLHRV